MHPLSIVVAQADCVAAEHLTASLHQYFRTVAVARDLDELRRNIARHHANAAVVDLELVSIAELRELCAEFDGLAVVCTHRIPDVEMWTSSLSIGAVDCCDVHDVRGIVTAISRTKQMVNARAA